MLNPLEGMRVLIVDDNAIYQHLINHILFQWQVSTCFAMNGKKALEMVSENIYDVVLMDTMMPIMNGYEATRSIRSLEGEYFRNLPIIVFTRMPDFEMMHEYGITDFFTDMPSLKEELYAILSRYLK